MSAVNSVWEAAIGLEVHVQLNTRTKLFSRTSNEDVLALPNQNANLVDLGFPGTLPVLNQAALAQAIRFGVAIEAPIAKVCTFDRKNYFYPDLPKGYQISQFSQPIVGTGVFHLWLRDDQTKPIRIRQAHLEEDAGKSIHDRFPDATALDFNRAGMPLLEVVTEPDLNTPSEAVSCFRQLHALVVWLDLCTGKLNEGAIRCDANVSLRAQGEGSYGTPSEIKNLNSFKFLEKALRYEIHRQTELLSTGKAVQRETRLYDPASDTTQPMRRKEQQEDYRYFPDPDLPPIPVSKSFITQIASNTLELPAPRRDRFIHEFGLAPERAYRLTLERPLADLFETTTKLCNAPEATAKWILGEFTAVLKLKHSHAQNFPISPDQLAQIIVRVKDGTISLSTGKKLLRELWDTELDVDHVIRTKELVQVSDSDQISTWVAQVIDDNLQLIPNLLNGEEKLYEYFIGQVMNISRGKANPQQVRKSLERKFNVQSQQLSAKKTAGLSNNDTSTTI